MPLRDVNIVGTRPAQLARLKAANYAAALSAIDPLAQQQSAKLEYKPS